jgi:RNA polymerase sigma factor (sigma-70 family)
VQEAFVRAWQSSKTPRHLDGFRPWLYKIMVNLIRDHRRRERRWHELRQVENERIDPAVEAERLYEQSKLAVAINRLTPREREVVFLRFFEQVEYAEVARILGTPEVTLRVLLHRTLRKLRKDLDGIENPGVSQTA